MQMHVFSMRGRFRLDRVMPRDNLGDDPAQFVRSERLGQEIDRAQSHRGHGVWNAPMRRDDHNRSIVLCIPHSPQSFHAIHAGHLQIQQHHVGGC